MERKDLSPWIKDRARALGFDGVGIASGRFSPRYESFLRWVAEGCAGEMGYLASRPHLRASLDPVLPGARSVISLARAYGGSGAGTDRDPRRASISIASRGDDYHAVLKDSLRRLCGEIAREEPGARMRACVDTAPVLERAWAESAGVGWIGKNTCLITARHGSFLFLGEILTDLGLEPDEPDVDRCGRCDLCVAACPTGALRAPYRLDARLCISYLTVEKRGVLPEGVRPFLGNAIFGCDICQQVCPWNERSLPTTEERFRPRADLADPPLDRLSLWDEAAFREKTRGSAIRRLGHERFLRNVIVAMGNSGDPAFLGALRAVEEREGIRPRPVLEEAIAWARVRIGR